MKQAWNLFLRTCLEAARKMTDGTGRESRKRSAATAAVILVMTAVLTAAGSADGALVAFAGTAQAKSASRTEQAAQAGTEKAGEETQPAGESAGTKDEKAEAEEGKRQDAQADGSESAGEAAQEREDTEEIEGTESAETEPDSAGAGASQEKRNAKVPAWKQGPGYTETDPAEAADMSGDAGAEGSAMEEDAKAAGTADANPETDAGQETEEASAQAVRLADQDYNVLLKIVQAEAGNCDMIGRILVANVVLNRVDSPKFPDTVKEVVYQKAQFSPVSNGSINRCQVTGQTVEAVERALAGEDYSQGALYFMNRSTSSSGNVSWFDRSLTYLFRHGSHEFFR